MRTRAPWSVYIARCADGSLYTGISKDVAARLAAHNAGRGAAYTRPRRPLRLVHREDGLTHGKALSREARIKALPRPAKLALLKAARAAVAAVLLLSAGALRARATPAFTPEGTAFFSSTTVQSFAPSVSGTLCYPSSASCYPLRMFMIPQSSGNVVTSATSLDGVTWTQDASSGWLSTTTLPSIVASSITAASVLPRSGGGFDMFYSAVSTSIAGNLYAIYTATSADGLSWANATTAAAPAASAAPVIRLNAGLSYVGSPRVVVIPGPALRMYLTANTDAAADRGNRRVFTSSSTDGGVSWSVPSVLPSTVAYEVGASQLTDGRVRLYYASPVSGQSSATVVSSMISADATGTSFTAESGSILSTAATTGSLDFPVPVRSTDSFRWRLYYDLTPAGASTGTIASALTGAPAPTGVSPASDYNTVAAAPLTVRGEIFSSGAPSFLLRTTGEPDIVATGVTRVSDESLTGTINTVAQAPGLRDLVVTNADGTSTTLANAFTITFPPGSASLLDNLISPRSGTTATKIAVTVYNAGNTTVKIFTVDGRHVTTIYDGPQAAGVLNLTWNGTFANGSPAPSGLYVVHVTGQNLDTRLKIVVIR